MVTSEGSLKIDRVILFIILSVFYNKKLNFFNLRTEIVMISSFNWYIQSQKDSPSLNPSHTNTHILLNQRNKKSATFAGLLRNMNTHEHSYTEKYNLKLRIDGEMQKCHVE